MGPLHGEPISIKDVDVCLEFNIFPIGELDFGAHAERVEESRGIPTRGTNFN